MQFVWDHQHVANSFKLVQHAYQTHDSRSTLFFNGHPLSTEPQTALILSLIASYDVLEGAFG